MKVFIKQKIQLKPSDLEVIIKDFLNQKGYDVNDQNIEWLISNVDNKIKFGGCAIDTKESSEEVT